jgi:hypothetical protein
MVELESHSLLQRLHPQVVEVVEAAEVVEVELLDAR